MVFHTYNPWTIPLEREPMSQDEAIGVLLGLALVHKCMEGTNEEITANWIARRIIQWIHGASGIPYWIKYPDGGLFSCAQGGCCQANSVGFAWAGNYFGWPYLEFTDLYTNGITAHLAWQLQQANIANSEMLTTNQTMAATLAAIGDSWYPASDEGINAVTQEWAVNSFYLLLWAYLHDGNTNYSSMVDSKSQAENQINTAPCEGPYWYSETSNSGNGGWSYNYRWHGALWEQYGNASHTEVVSGDVVTADHPKGIWHGLDFMLLYNLYQLVYNPTMSDYHYYNNRDIQGAYPYCASWLSDPCTMGSDALPINLYAFNSIVSTLNVNNTVTDGNNVVLPITGNVTFVAGKEIRLLPGFHAQEGSYFHAYIDNFNGCNEFNTSDKIINTDTLQQKGKQNNNDLTQSKISSFLLYPNPTNSTITIEIKDSDVNGISDISIYNVMSNRIYHDQISTSQFTIDMSTFAKGMYLIKVQKGDEIFSEKVILE